MRARQVNMYMLSHLRDHIENTSVTVANVTVVGKVQDRASQHNGRRELPVYVDLERHPEWK